jgi:hypothetical protein
LAGYRYYAIVPDSAAERVLLRESEGRWTLPYFECDHGAIWQAVDHVNREMRDRLGIEVTTLRCMGIFTHPTLGTGSPVYELENHGSEVPAPPGTRWFGRDELAEIELAVPEHRAVLTDWSAAVPRHDAAGGLPPWYRPGWFEGAARWTSEAIADAGLQRTGPVEQFRSSQRSAVLRAETAGGRVYFKAVPEMFGHEGALTIALAERFPDLVPRVIEVAPDRNWLLTEGCGESDLSAYDDLGVWGSALAGYARLQIELAGQTDWLFGLGCPDRGLGGLPGAIDRLLADTDAMLPGTPWGLNESGIGRLRERAPELKAACRALADYAVPQSLEHGDFGYWQVIVRRGRSRFIDWSDASISHPFFSLWFLLEELQYGAPKMVEHQLALRDAYLEPWTEFEPMDRLTEAFRLAGPLASLHQAAISHDTIVPASEVRWEWEKMVPYCLKRLLRDPSA